MQKIATSEPIIRIEPVSPVLGAMIHGVDLKTQLSEETVRTLRQALLDHKLILFRDQDISSEQHLGFGRHFGELEVHPFNTNKIGYPEIVSLFNGPDSSKRENVWHSDVSWRETPSLGSILIARELPPLGGDTLFANMEAAYERLSEELKEKLEGLQARHDAPNFHRILKNRGISDADIQALQTEFPPVTHPVVRTHPETGRKSLYVNRAFTQAILDMATNESDALLDHLYQQAHYPEFQYRFQWQLNSIAFWDNRAVQHYPVADYWPERRLMERVTIIGDKPF